MGREAKQGRAAEAKEGRERPNSLAGGQCVRLLSADTEVQGGGQGAKNVKKTVKGRSETHKNQKNEF